MNCFQRRPSFQRLDAALPTPKHSNRYSSRSQKLDWSYAPVSKGTFEVISVTFSIAVISLKKKTQAELHVTTSPGFRLIQLTISLKKKGTFAKPKVEKDVAKVALPSFANLRQQKSHIHYFFFP